MRVSVTTKLPITPVLISHANAKNNGVKTYLFFLNHLIYVQELRYLLLWISLDNSVLYCAVSNYFHLRVNHNSPIDRLSVCPCFSLLYCFSLTREWSELSPGQEGRRKGVRVFRSCQRLALGEGRESVVCFVLLRVKRKVARPSVVLP